MHTLEGSRRRHDGEGGHQRNETEPLDRHGWRRPALELDRGSDGPPSRIVAGRVASARAEVLVGVQSTTG